MNTPATRYKLVSCKSSEKKRFQNAFTVCNVALDAVVSDMFGKFASSITDYLLSSDSFDPERCSSFLQKSLKQNESAGKKKSVKISRAGVYLKPALVQVAHASVKSTISPYYKNKYERLCKRRGKKRAIIAIARMILTAIYNMLDTGEEWNPSDLYKIDMPQEMLEKQKEKAISQALKLLISNGVIKAADISAA